MFVHLKNIITGITLIVLTAQAMPVFAASSSDISMIGIGARPMGMGKAYVALADDASAMFLNPAGLAQVQKPQLISMQANLMNDVNYLTFGGIMPFGPGTIGLSLLQSYVDGIALTELDADGRPRTTETVSYFEGIWTLSYGMPVTQYVNGLFKTEIPGKIYGGISAKYFHKGVQGLVAGGGTNADVGLLYHMDETWDFGLRFRNIIPSLGVIGSINWDTGASDGVVSYTTFGVGYTVDPKWKVLLDYDGSFLNKRKGLFHFGTEYRFDTFAAIRLGWEQLHDAIGQDTTDHITFGLSLMVNGFSVDYAYQPYYGLLENTTHFISFGYTFDTPQAPVYSFDQTYEEVAEERPSAPEIEVSDVPAVPESTQSEAPVVNVDSEGTIELVEELDIVHQEEQELCSAYEEAASGRTSGYAGAVEDDSVSLRSMGEYHVPLN